MKKSFLKGFTLVELAIVFIIIGFVISAIVVSGEIIEASEVSAQISQFKDFDVAVTTFTMKYGTMPGDMDSATANRYNFAQPSGGSIVAFNAVLEDLSAFTPVRDNNGEPAHFFVHLSQSNVMPVVTAQTVTSARINEHYPESKLGEGGIIPTSMTDGRILWFLGLDKALDDVSNVRLANKDGPILTPEQAFRIDEKLDNGVANTGIVQAYEAYTTDPTLRSYTSGCVDGSDNSQYDMSNFDPACSIGVYSDFIPSAIY